MSSLAATRESRRRGDTTFKKKTHDLLSVLEPNAAHLAANYVARNNAPLKRKAKRKTKRKAKAPGHCPERGSGHLLAVRAFV